MKTFNQLVSKTSNQNISSLALLFLRLFVGILMLTHGRGKLMLLFSGNPIQFPDPIGLGTNFSLILAVFAEFFCSVLLILGLYTRLASIPLITTMLITAFVVHANDAFSAKELAIIYLVIYITLFIAGAGKYSIDYALFGKTKRGY